ncbi:MAG: phage tail assembly chaperone [Novosphingobium sp.]
MKRYYSPSTGGFYSDQVNGPRKIEGPLTEREKKAGKRPPMIDNPACTLPADAFEISEERFAELMEAQAGGKQIVTMGSKPVAVERTIDEAERVAARRRKRNLLLTESDWTQIPDAPLDALTRKAWAAYRKALRDLDMNGTDWPDQPGSESSAAS